MLKKQSILTAAAMTVLMAFAGQVYAGHSGHGGGGGGSFHPQMSGGNMGMRQSGNFQVQHNMSHNVSNMQSNVLKLQTNHGNVLSNNHNSTNIQNSNIHLANNPNHNKLPNVLNSNGNKNGHGLGISLNNISNKGMNSQHNQGNFKQICPPWGCGTGKYNGCWGNYGGCFGNYGGCYNNSGYGYGCGYYPWGYYPCGYTNWGYGCGNYGYTCGYFPRYFTCYSYPVVQPCPVVSSAYVTTTQVVTTVPTVSNVVVNEPVSPVGSSLALSDVAIPPSPVQ